jgi:hypothetical protein
MLVLGTDLHLAKDRTLDKTQGEFLYLFVCKGMLAPVIGLSILA